MIGKYDLVNKTNAPSFDRPFRTGRSFNIHCSGAWEGVQVKICQECDPARVRVYLSVPGVYPEIPVLIGSINDAEPLLLAMLDKMAESGGSA